MAYNLMFKPKKSQQFITDFLLLLNSILGTSIFILFTAACQHSAEKMTDSVFKFSTNSSASDRY